jgi:hypothetical protein
MAGPLYLLADSQLLFWQGRGKTLLAGVRERLLDANAAAVYIGASNGDNREFYSIFEAAMDAAGFADRSMINSSFNADDRERLNRAQLIVLSGGDVQLGWNTFEKTGMKEQILARHAQGAVLVGVSAGAVVRAGLFGCSLVPKNWEYPAIIPSKSILPPFAGSAPRYTRIITTSPSVSFCDSSSF